MYKGKVKSVAKQSRRPEAKTYYYFNGDNNSEDERMSKREMIKHKEYRKLLNFLLSKKQEK
jgi:hypothetical protein